MAKVTVELPSLLSGILGTDPRIDLEARSLSGALEALVERVPGVRVHLFDETGDLREHVLCFHNDQNSRWLDSMDVGLTDGDTITIVQAVSGG